MPSDYGTKKAFGLTFYLNLRKTGQLGLWQNDAHTLCRFNRREEN